MNNNINKKERKKEMIVSYTREFDKRFDLKDKPENKECTIYMHHEDKMYDLKKNISIDYFNDFNLIEAAKHRVYFVIPEKSKLDNADNNSQALITNAFMLDEDILIANIVHFLAYSKNDEIEEFYATIFNTNKFFVKKQTLSVTILVGGSLHYTIDFPKNEIEFEKYINYFKNLSDASDARHGLLT